MQARNLEKILRERNVEIAALKSRLSSEVNEPESLDLIGSPPPKVSLKLKDTLSSLSFRFHHQYFLKFHMTYLRLYFF